MLGLGTAFALFGALIVWRIGLRWSLPEPRPVEEGRAPEQSVLNLTTRVAEPARQAAPPVPVSPPDKRVPALPAPAGVDALRNLSDSLRTMTATLVKHERDLADAKAGLDARMAARAQEMQRMTSELARLTRHDSLTGLANRRNAEE